MSAMGIRLSSTIWELFMLPPSWLPGNDSLSLKLRPVPKIDGKSQISISSKDVIFSFSFLFSSYITLLIYLNNQQ